MVQGKIRSFMIVEPVNKFYFFINAELCNKPITSCPLEVYDLCKYFPLLAHDC